MGRRDFLFLSVIVAGGAMLTAGLVRPVIPTQRPVKAATTVDTETADAIESVAARVDEALAEDWAGQGVRPTPLAHELTLVRRLSLALTGKVPSLEEIRKFEARPTAGRLDAWLDDMLADRRAADYLAERFTRVYVGTEDGPFLLFRRRRFRTWLSDQLFADRPYDAIVRDLIAEDGVWTDHPATNFISVTYDMDTQRPDAERLAARVARAFLGVRLDCAQCHDHPFQPWKQADFRGLAAFFGGLHSDLRGVRDGENTYKPKDRKTDEPQDVTPSVPFQADLLPESGGPRDRLASWVIDPKNPGLSRATANRAWALMFGRPLVDPIDDLPASGEVPAALDVLAADFREHGFSLRRLVRVIASTEAFRRDSGDEDDRDTVAPSASAEDESASWASFPLTPMRPEQVAGSIFQAASLSTLAADSHWLVRLAVYNGRNDFVRRYGDVGEDSFDAHAGTIPQRLLLMNGQIVRDKIKADMFNASSAIATLAPNDRKAVEVAYLAVLTRRPTPEELDHFAGRLEGTTGQERKDRLTDLYWTLLNSTEFSWNH
jgi:hypothetical protein